MASVKNRVRKGSRKAAAVASVAGKRAAGTMVRAADKMIVKLGEAAKKRQRARKAKSALKTAGKVALVLGAGAATMFAGKSVLARVNARGRKRR